MGGGEGFRPMSAADGGGGFGFNNNNNNNHHHPQLAPLPPPLSGQKRGFSSSLRGGSPGSPFDFL